ncbi:MAG: 2-isopropylmalate synthase [Candidatus Omnitrophica bacterium]|nr:2-isopropylmalate synthase [Candidatus Omnitrophota bacterium]
MTEKRIIIFDTTLRDGEQCPGASLTPKEKLEIARQLARLKVDVIEAGFPVSSQGEVEAVRLISKEVKGPVIAGLSRAIRKDLEVCLKALEGARKKRVHLFLATSRIHMEFKLKKSEQEVMDIAVKEVRQARKFVDDVEFSPEDASRSNPEFLVKLIREVIRAGATTINIPDTVGYAIPDKFGELIHYLIREIPDLAQGVVLSVHCHNDLGLATANSLAAVLNGARQVECTINGIGERAGNTSLEEVVMALKTREDFYGVTTGIDTTQIHPASRLVSHLTGMVVQPNKAIVGANAFAHEAGIHQDGVIKKAITYEIMDPKSVGLSGSTLVIGKHSGRHAFLERLKQLGYELKEDQVERAFELFKELADKKKDVFDEDLTALIEQEIVGEPCLWELDHFTITSGDAATPKATLGLSKDGKVLEATMTGDGPVDACFKTIEKITGVKGALLDYSTRSVTRGKDALGEVSVRVSSGKRLVSGRGLSTDVIEASIKAYLSAINRLAVLAERIPGDHP